MDGIQALSNNSSNTAAAGSSSASGTSGLSINDFYKLLAAQMQYQDADNPMDTSEMMAQMVQTHMIEAITNMSTINTITYASSMVGKEVT
ncbi:MAG TPA: flagellar hook capping protein, partial [Lachnospiraceae bacterium]|nr:flagellar hook capping protein [Lachnospiraceae bacterium]